MHFSKKEIPICTMVLVAMNLFIFLITDALNMLAHFSIFGYGALSWSEVFYHHEYYRLLTAMFLHLDPTHVCNNMIVLFVIGSYLEKYSGKIRFLILYFSSGILAGFFSMVYNMHMNRYVTSVGASGAISGVMSALLVVVMIRHGQNMAITYKNIIFMIVFCLYAGLSSRNTDNMAHIGGFISGFILEVLLFLPEIIKIFQKRGIKRRS
jgi:rhomboid protease GluP